VDSSLEAVTQTPPAKASKVASTVMVRAAAGEAKEAATTAAAVEVAEEVKGEASAAAGGGEEAKGEKVTLASAGAVGTASA
jgi:hypothetical protein